MHMTHARWALVLAAAVLLGGCADGRKPAPAVDTAAIGAAVDSVKQACNAAIAARDTNAIAECYATDARVLPASMPRVEGKDAIRTWWAMALSAPGLELTLTPGQKLVSEAGDMVVDIGTYDYKAAGPKGQPMKDRGKHVTVLKKVDGRWKLVVDTWNSDSPPPGTAK
jgi:uncharacterized protein (TIGR02246 family)